MAFLLALVTVLLIAAAWFLAPVLDDWTRSPECPALVRRLIFMGFLVNAFAAFFRIVAFLS